MATTTVKQLFDLRGKVALVTGGAMGIGEGIARRLAEAGASVAIADIDEAHARKTAESIVQQDGSAQAFQVDVSDVASLQRVVTQTVGALGGLDILVNNAGIFPFAPALQVSESLWDKVLGVNLKGSFFLAQAAARQMIASGKGGSIVNIASIDALHPSGNLVHYDSSKGGVVMMTKALALEFGAHHIRVNAIAPGGIATPGAAASTAGVTQDHSAATEDFTKAFLARIPLGRMGEPDDIAAVALFLASDAARYMTGSLLVVDGGYLLS